jgi:sugar/nucleoside kinase (ribokinase family)
MVLSQVQRPSIVALDTMNFWIDGKIGALRKVLKEADILIINDGEAQALGDNRNLVQVSRIIRSFGPRTLIIKRGEYGVAMFHGDAMFALPAYPLDDLKDPTGAGDSFAGGFMGFLASASSSDEQSLRQAVVYGSVMASFAVQSFSVDRLAALTDEDIKKRYIEFSRFTTFQV